MGSEELDPGPTKSKLENFKNPTDPRQSVPKNKHALDMVAPIVAAQQACPNGNNSMDLDSSTDDEGEDHMVDDTFDDNVDNVLDGMFLEEVVPSSF